jgi:selenocysteine-specific elongation factor
MILGTAGHIDHGKTALVRALTGVDTDRLPEEKRRGITIELGFAPLVLEDVGIVGVVDVPGHEAFVRTMLAGATGVDLALIVVAADEGVMPQTREHVAILQLLGVRGGVVALTKCDLVDDPDWLALVHDDVRTLLEGSALAEAPIVATSAKDGQGLDDLRRALATATAAVPQRRDDDVFRMPVDRAFTVRGTGTVVTGTVWTGRLDRDENVRVWPGGRAVRVRTLQTHGESVDCVRAGQRAAIALAGVDVHDVARGTMLVTGDAWRPSSVLRAETTLLADSPIVIGPRTRLRFHLGTSEIGARVVAASGSHTSGRPFAARIVLEHPVVARAGDRFVLRLASPATTIGGGVICDPLPPRRARPWPLGLGTTERLRLLLDEAGAQGIEVTSLPVRLGLSSGAVAELTREATLEVKHIGTRLVARDQLDRIASEAVDAVRSFHVMEPLEPGMAVQLLRARLDAPADVVDAVLRDQAGAGQIHLESALVRLARWTPTLNESEQRLADVLVSELAGAGAEPPSTGELAVKHGNSTSRLLRFLERRGLVTAVESDRYYERGALVALLERLRNGMSDGRAYAPAELRELLGVSRKYLIPLLEHCDRVGYTARHGDGRVWRDPHLETTAGEAS